MLQIVRRINSGQSSLARSNRGISMDILHDGSGKLDSGSGLKRMDVGSVASRTATVILVLNINQSCQWPARHVTVDIYRLSPRAAALSRLGNHILATGSLLAMGCPRWSKRLCGLELS